MIPSDHFVRFYNEVFKFLDKKNDLEKYYLHISRHQEAHCLEAFRKNGLRGEHGYYEKIFKEENCVGGIVLHDDCSEHWMDKCPSLSKAMDNDAGGCPKYCLHCPGWTMPLYTKAGLYKLTDLVGLDVPKCHTWVFDKLEKAQAKYRELARRQKKELIACNFETE